MRWFWSFVAILAIAGVAVLATVGDRTSTGSGVVDAGARGEATATASSTAAPDDAARTDLDRKDTGRQEADRLDTAPKPSDRSEVERYTDLGVKRLVVPIFALGRGNPVENFQAFGQTVIAKIE